MLYLSFETTLVYHYIISGPDRSRKLQILHSAGWKQCIVSNYRKIDLTYYLIDVFIIMKSTNLHMCAVK